MKNPSSASLAFVLRKEAEKYEGACSVPKWLVDLFDEADAMDKASLPKQSIG